MTQYMSNAEGTQWKRKLTTAKRKGPAEVIRVVDAFMAREQDGVALPDWWHTMNIAREDAQFELRRMSPSW